MCFFSAQHIPIIRKFRWCICTKGYAYALWKRSDDKGMRSILMHNLILGRTNAGKDSQTIEAHHLNHNKLDNRDDNLSVINRMEHKLEHGCRYVCSIDGCYSVHKSRGYCTHHYYTQFVKPQNISRKEALEIIGL